jgi:hypothetical protein
MVSQISNEINPLGAPLEVESVENNPVRAGAQLFSDGGQFLHAAKGSNPRCRFQLTERQDHLDRSDTEIILLRKLMAREVAAFKEARPIKYWRWSDEMVAQTGA